VKCTEKFVIRGRSASLPLEESCVGSWTRSLVPVYLVLVILEANRQSWIGHQDAGTLLRAAAFWVRVDQLADPTSIRVPKEQRLTIDTVGLWHRELCEAFGAESRSSEGGVT